MGGIWNSEKKKRVLYRHRIYGIRLRMTSSDGLRKGPFGMESVDLHRMSVKAPPPGWSGGVRPPAFTCNSRLLKGGGGAGESSARPQ